MALITIKIKGVKNIREVNRLFKETQTWHAPTRFVQTPDVWEVTIRETDPMVSYLQLKYGNRERA